MDGVTHTIIAVGLLYAAFTAGKFIGAKEAVMHLTAFLVANNFVKTKFNERTQEHEFIKHKDHNG